ncbi:hypothetical protein PVA45_08215 (plasmid) [Entomospira entomophila]|uniref:Uncharacterized protein n=1 Tax=Entomospira entomophila TaxID=2719988 RepID=A0A968KX49_9SPIO|nr:hypothetical protein [Entomospira entomophilus]NIZ41490.1 hypothetical protein [Entomospira entomophilus]WDI36324.1 hypothetical protein PVA45_08215 [Entomospira entomophilus]
MRIRAVHVAMIHNMIMLIIVVILIVMHGRTKNSPIILQDNGILIGDHLVTFGSSRESIEEQLGTLQHHEDRYWYKPLGLEMGFDAYDRLKSIGVSPSFLLTMMQSNTKLYRKLYEKEYQLKWRSNRWSVSTTDGTLISEIPLEVQQHVMRHNQDARIMLVQLSDHALLSMIYSEDKHLQFFTYQSLHTVDLTHDPLETPEEEPLDANQSA